MTFHVIGAGMAGLLAAALLRDECDSVIEKQPALPDNHHALLRFRTSAVGDALGISFRPVDVLKAVQPQANLNPIADAVAYSIKTNGTATLRSSLSARGEVERRWIAPPDFLVRMRNKVTAKLHFGYDITDAATPWAEDGPSARAISTVPMPVLMAALDYPGPRPTFNSAPGIVITATVPDANLCASLYVPGKEHQAYRISMTGDKLMLEFAVHGNTSVQGAFDVVDALKSNLIWKALALLGMPGLRWESAEVAKQRFAKILPIDEKVRRGFMLWASEKFGIYSFGRFATWRPGLLLDDLIHDLTVIRRLANEGTYSKRIG